MSEVKLGKLIDSPVGRDAVHVAIAPVVCADESLIPGSHVGLVGNTNAVSIYSHPYVGVVDPFLMGKVKHGEQFYLCLYPNTVTSLRHVWTHPAFKPKVPNGTES